MNRISFWRPYDYIFIHYVIHAAVWIVYSKLTCSGAISSQTTKKTDVVNYHCHYLLIARLYANCDVSAFVHVQLVGKHLYKIIKGEKIALMTGDETSSLPTPVLSASGSLSPSLPIFFSFALSSKQPYITFALFTPFCAGWKTRKIMKRMRFRALRKLFCKHDPNCPIVMVSPR